MQVGILELSLDGGVRIGQVMTCIVVSYIPHQHAPRKGRTAKGSQGGPGWGTKQVGLTLTFAPDIEVPPRVPGDHIATLQKGHTQHVLRFLVFLRWGRRGRCQRVAEAGRPPRAHPSPRTMVQGMPSMLWGAALWGASSSPIHLHGVSRCLQTTF